MIEFFIAGNPVTQGSKSRNRRGGMFESAKGLRAWRTTVAKTAMACRRGRGPFEGAVRVNAVFYFARPKKPRRAYPTRDLDKLLRALGDGLTDGGLIVDDCQVTVWFAEKRYATDGAPVGVHVTIGDAGEWPYSRA